MIIRLVFEEDVPLDVDRPPRIAQRDFEWEEDMGESFTLSNPNNPKDTLKLEVIDNTPGENGKPKCLVIEDDGRLANFEEILKYGFAEVNEI